MIRDRIRGFLRGDSAEQHSYAFTKTVPVVDLDAPPVQRTDHEILAERSDGFYNTITGLGDAASDKGSSFRPAQAVLLSFEDLNNAWFGSYYARRVVDLLAGDSVVRWHKVLDPSNPLAVEDPRWQQEASRLGMAQALRHAEQYALAYGTGYIIPITHGNDNLQEPLDMLKITSVQQLLVLDPKECRPERYFGVQSPYGRIGAPSQYRVNIAGGRTLAGRWGDVLVGNKGIHASRVIPIIGLPVSESQKVQLPFGEGVSLLSVLWLALARADMIDAGGAHLVQEIKQDVIRIPDLAAIGTSDTKSAFEWRMRMLKLAKGLLGMIVLADGEEFESRASSVSGFDELAENCRNALVAASGISEPILFGKATSGLATAPGAEQEAYHRKIDDIRLHNINPAAMRIYSLIAAAKGGPFATPYKVFTIEDNPLVPESKRDLATRRMVQAQRDSLHVGMLAKLDPFLGTDLAVHIMRARYGPNGWQDEIPEWKPPPQPPKPPPSAAPPASFGGGRPGENAVKEGLPGADLQVNNTGKGEFE